MQYMVGLWFVMCSVFCAHIWNTHEFIRRVCVCACVCVRTCTHTLHTMVSTSAVTAFWCEWWYVVQVVLGDNLWLTDACALLQAVCCAYKHVCPGSFLPKSCALETAVTIIVILSLFPHEFWLHLDPTDLMELMLLVRLRSSSVALCSSSSSSWMTLDSCSWSPEFSASSCGQQHKTEHTT